MILFVGLCAMGLWAGVVGSNRGGSGFWWFVAGFCLGIFGVIFAYCVGKQCTSCRKKIHSLAILCPYCGTRQGVRDPPCAVSRPALAGTPPPDATEKNIP